MDVPFPSDVYLQGGHVTFVPAMESVFHVGAQYLSHELAKADGFSRIAMALFFVDDPTQPPDDNGNVAPAIVDKTTLPVDETACLADSSAVFLLDLQASDPTKARVACRASFHYEPNGVRTTPLVAVGPSRGIVLQEGHTYVAVMTSRVKNTAGKPITASADFAAVQSGKRAGAVATMYGGAYDQATQILGPALAADQASIVAIAPYTTNSATNDLFAMRAQLETSQAPALKWDAASMAPMGAARFARPVSGTLPPGFTASLDDWLGVVDPSAHLPDGTDDPDQQLPVRPHDKIAAIATGEFDAINYLQTLDGGYPTLDHATFARDAGGSVIPAPDKPTAKIWITLAVPTAPMPPGGYPVVIVQHGLGGSRSFLLALANTFAGKGWMSVAIDSVTFGARAPEASYQVDANTNYQKAPGAKYKGPDGIADSDAQGNTNGSTDLFGNLENIGAVRDQFRQAEFDTSQVVKLLRSPLDLSALQTGAAPPKIDRTRIAYVGDSLGAMEGTVAAAIEPYVSLWALNVDGGSLLVDLAAHSPSINALLRVAAFGNFGFEESAQNESHILVNLIQQIVDGGDPIAYAPLLVTSPRNVMGAPATTPRNILQFQVVYDEIVSNESNEALARAGGWGLAVPNVGSNSEIVDFRNLANNPRRVPLPDVTADAAGLIHDTPVAGVTAVVVQESPATHGNNLVSSKGQRQFGIPYGDFDAPEPFIHLDMSKYFKVRCPYLATQATIARFFDDGFQGHVPNVTVAATPIRDLDDDGAPDDVDADPADPTVK